MRERSSAERLEQPFGTLPQMIAAHAAERPTALAVVDDDTVMTFGELDALIDRAAAAFQRDGVEPGSAVAFCALNSAAYLAVMIGALRAGLAACPLATGLAAEALARMLEDCRPAALFVDQASDTPDAAWSGRRIALDGSNAGEGLEAWLAPHGARPEPIQVAPEDTFNIAYSSGTTGAPKGVVQSHALRWMQISVIRHCQPGDVMMASTPIYSNTTLSCALVPVLARGAAVVLMRKFDARRFLELAERWRATHAVLVPVQVGRILADPEFGRFDLTSFRHKLCTGAPFPVELKRDAVARWPGAMAEVYSMSEGGPAAGFDAAAHPDKLHTVGKPSIGADVRIVGEDGRELGPGQIGEVVGHSRTMMTGYYNQPEATAAAEWRDSTGKRFIRSGDLGCFDEDGFLVIVGRKKDMIISGGLNVYPSDIEAVLAQNPAVAEAAVVGAPSRKWGETPVAFVTPAEGAVRDPDALAREILTWTNLRVGKAQRLAAVKLVDEMPRNHLGKVLKRDLRSRCGAFA